MGHQTRQSILCPNCRKLISRNETRCPYCGVSKPGAWIKRLFSLRSLNNPEAFLKLTIYINIGMYVISLLLNSRLPGMTYNPFAMLSPENRSLLFLGATGRIPIDVYHRWWTLIAANYLHGNILHILFNMLAFRQLGLLTIREYGLYRTVIIYTISGVAGFWVSYLAGVNFTIGASAAICGLMGSMIYYGKKRGGIYGQMLYRQIGGWVLAIFLFGLLVPNINNWGHGGGLSAGTLLGFLLGDQEKSTENLYHRAIGTGLAMITLLTLVWAITSGIYLRIAA